MAGIVQKKPSVEVVASVGNDIVGPDQIVNVSGGQSGVMLYKGYFRIYFSDCYTRAFYLG